MSFFASGYFLLQKKMTYHDKVNLSFYLQQCAVSNSLGLVIDGNVGNNIRRYFLEDSANKMLFSITDNPTTNVAQVLFSNDVVKIYENHVRVDTGESPACRMNRLRTFWGDVLRHPEIENILLNINVDFNQDIEPIEISITEFHDYMVKHMLNPKWSEEERLLIHR